LPRRIESRKRPRAAVPEPFVDTDVIVCLLTGDDPQKQAEATALFTAVERGELTLAAPDTVIFDVVYVLASPRLYHPSRTHIRDVLASVVRPPNFKVAHKGALLWALDLFASTNLPFGDAYLVASLREAGSRVLYSYDAHFDRLPNLERREPTTNPAITK
jgi:predicted nucleic acid-binding protein